jgi:tetratricopeptide (TPR) repeat protein
MGNLADTYRALGRHADALAMEEQVLEFRCRVLPVNHPSIGEGCALRDGLHWMCRSSCFFPAGSSLHNISLSYEKSSLLPRALECAREALRIWQASLPPGHEHVALAQSQVRRLERALQ